MMVMKSFRQMHRAWKKIHLAWDSYMNGRTIFIPPRCLTIANCSPTATWASKCQNQNIVIHYVAASIGRTLESNRNPIQLGDSIGKIATFLGFSIFQRHIFALSIETNEGKLVYPSRPHCGLAGHPFSNISTFYSIFFRFKTIFSQQQKKTE